MSSGGNIRWRDSDRAEVKRAIKNFNAKVRRVAKKDPQNKHLLPATISEKEFLSEIVTRQDLNRELNSLKRFSKRGAEKIEFIDPSVKHMDEIEQRQLSATKWEISEAKRRLPHINRRRAERKVEQESIEAESRGEKLGYKAHILGMGTIERHELRPLKLYEPNMERVNVKRRLKRIKKEAYSNYWETRDEQLRENYINGLLRNYQEYEIRDLISTIRNMSIKQFRAKFMADVGKFEEVYAEERLELHLNALYALWLPNKKTGK